MIHLTHFGFWVLCLGWLLIGWSLCYVYCLFRFTDEWSKIKAMEPLKMDDSAWPRD